MHGKQLVVGQGILTTDLRAAAMVTPIPSRLLDRTIDTLAFVHRVRGGSYPVGCNLDDLVREILGAVRRKLRFPTSAPGLRPGGTMGMSPDRHGADPTLAWGAGKPVWTHAKLDDEHIAELTADAADLRGPHHLHRPRVHLAGRAALDGAR
ncbi:hypothetical protein OG698_00740 [Streptomyces sp. NBC_01003]|uniref:hypothetical protein n=1 Tax=Streptomyces sp. NBC_01003 TaxID=2903714 RepID=UPI00386DA873|nr:hypothetical protein OG698_00740 [Streptomyces sp. NBC_01003]